MKLEIGKTYQINHKRKGEFWGRCLGLDEEWGEFQIVSGKARYMSVLNDDRGEGEILTIRLSLCIFKPLPKE